MRSQQRLHFHHAIVPLFCGILARNVTLGAARKAWLLQQLPAPPAAVSLALPRAPTGTAASQGVAPPLNPPCRVSRSLQESKDSVSNAEMAQLMNMSAKVARAVEAWRSRQVGPYRSTCSPAVRRRRLCTCVSPAPCTTCCELLALGADRATAPSPRLRSSLPHSRGQRRRRRTPRRRGQRPRSCRRRLECPPPLRRRSCSRWPRRAHRLPRRCGRCRSHVPQQTAGRRALPAQTVGSSFQSWWLGLLLPARFAQVGSLRGSTGVMLVGPEHWRGFRRCPAAHHLHTACARSLPMLCHAAHGRQLLGR